jgi:hypothetical protein
MRNLLSAILLTGLSAGALIAAPAANAEPAQCFYSHDWDGWKATPDSKTIFIKVGVNQIYRIDLARECLTLQAPRAQLLTDTPGNSAICTALDLNLRVADGLGGSKVSCIPSDLHRLSKEEAAALPKNLRP